MINESYKNRIKRLAGIITLNEDTVTLTANTGRSDEDTLSFYSEDYLLNLGSKILTQLDTKVEKDENLKLQLSKQSTKLNQNSLLINVSISGNVSGVIMDEKFDIVLTVQFSDDSNTTASISVKGIVNKFNLSSKHSKEDLDKFINEITDNIINSLKLSSTSQK